MEERDSNGLTEKEFLENYKPGDYERPSVTVDMLLVGADEKYSTLKILLIKRKNHPFINKWAFPGGFVGINESAYKAACRELEEETGLTDVYMEQLYTFTDPTRDPRMRVIDIAYLALLPTCPTISGDDAKETAWFNFKIENDELILKSDEHNITMTYKLTKRHFKNGVIAIENYDKPEPISTEQLAFDHAQILVESMLRLRNKIEYTDLVFNLMPPKFTMTDLMKAYETILGKELYRKNFRDKMKTKTIATGEKGISLSALGATPAELYSYKAQEQS